MVYLRMLAWSILLSACSALAGCSGSGDDDQTPAPTYTAHNVVLIIPDGMHNANEIQYSRYQYGTDKGASFHSWPYHCYMTTWDVTTYDRFAWAHGASRYDAADFDPLTGYDPARGGTVPTTGTVDAASDAYFITGLPAWGKTAADGTKEPATDSASAATAFATGHKTDDGNICWLPGDPANGSLETIGERFRRLKGGSVGTTSTVEFSHATPACFASHNVNRNNYGEIATEMLTQTVFDVIIGAGHPSFTMSEGAATDKYCPADALAAIKANSGYIVVEKAAGQDGGAALLAAAQQAAAQGKKLFGVFGSAGGQMAPIQPSDTPGSPSYDIPADDPHCFDIAPAALTVLSQNEHGFFLMVEQGDLDWTNHANDYAGGIGCMYDTDLTAKAVVDWINQPGDDITLANTSVILLPDHTHYIRQTTWLGRGDLPTQTPIAGDKESYEGDYRYPDGGPYYHSINHTNELGNVYVIGGGVGALLAGYEGDWYPGTRIVDNTQVYQAMCAWLGIN
jgi:alkaline phosphatase